MLAKVRFSWSRKTCVACQPWPWLPRSPPGRQRGEAGSKEAADQEGGSVPASTALCDTGPFSGP